MRFRESQKYKADLSKGCGFLLTVPVGNFGLDLIFKHNFDFLSMLLSFTSFLIAILSFYFGYKFTKSEDNRIEDLEQNEENKK